MDIVDVLFFIRLMPLALAGFITTRSKDWVGFSIAMLYVSVTTANYIYANASLNAIFSTPLVFLTSWYVIKHSREHVPRPPKAKGQIVETQIVEHQVVEHKD